MGPSCSRGLVRTLKNQQLSVPSHPLLLVRATRSSKEAERPSTPPPARVRGFVSPWRRKELREPELSLFVEKRKVLGSSLLVAWVSTDLCYQEWWRKGTRTRRRTGPCRASLPTLPPGFSGDPAKDQVPFTLPSLCFPPGLRLLLSDVLEIGFEGIRSFLCLVRCRESSSLFALNQADYQIFHILLPKVNLFSPSTQIPVSSHILF